MQLPDIIDDPGPHVCAVCGRSLSSVTQAGGKLTHFEHGDQDRDRLNADDHPVIPVPMGDIPGAPRCDFCNIDIDGTDLWLLPVADFGYGEVIMPGAQMVDEYGRIRGSRGEWLACPIDAEFIRTDQWKKVTIRAVRVQRVLLLEQFVNHKISARVYNELLQELGPALWKLHIKVRESATGPLQHYTLKVNA